MLQTTNADATSFSEELLRRGVLNGGIADGVIWVTLQEWSRLRAELSLRFDVPPNPGEECYLWGMPVRIKVDYLTEVVKRYAPKEEE